jgi:hypothetical protein
MKAKKVLREFRSDGRVARARVPAEVETIQDLVMWAAGYKKRERVHDRVCRELR